MTDDPRTGSTCWDLHPATPDRSWIVRFVVILALSAVIGIGFVRGVYGAEVPGKWEITLYHKGVDYDRVERTHRTLAVYDSKVECEVMITRVRVEIKGARLVCAPTETFRTN